MRTKIEQAKKFLIANKKTIAITATAVVATGIVVAGAMALGDKETIIKKGMHLATKVTGGMVMVAVYKPSGYIRVLAKQDVKNLGWVPSVNLGEFKDFVAESIDDMIASAVKRETTILEGVK